ncbi:serine hydrolase domain-containing protein [Sandaracinus amylolyticus]|uniref:Beta-lactamase class C n=1 Tax=Sandaracinus amylolyticus TaxID=927083 RepID=A0A0F6W9U0_9BACT|nr:serine hydrolase domain-containing protein [Sandaracinus amylolyticus]AKF11055.1 Beta-lactamase class C [Sandaracinus amylolyticus]
MHRLLAPGLALVLLACAGSPAPAPHTDRSLSARVDAVIDRAIEEERIVGAVVLVAVDGQVVHRRAAGLLDREAGTPMREDAIFRLASVSKPIVTAAALALVDAGTIGLDDPITRFLPELTFRDAEGRPSVITIRQLLNHTSGLGYGFFEPEDGPYHRAGVSDGLDQPGLSFEENARRLASVALLAEPGAAFGYSLSIDVLGEIVARAGGGALPEVVARLVTNPLAMRDTGFVVSDVDRLAVAYADGTPRPVRMEDGHVVPFGASGVRYAPSRALSSRSYPSGGAGMVGTAEDVLRVLEMIRRGGGAILRAETAQAMMRDQLGSADHAALGPGMGFGFGGAVVLDPALAGSAAHAATFRWGGAYGHSWFVDPEARITVVALTNTALEGMSGRFPGELERAVYGR